MSALQDMVDDMVAEHETSPADHFPELGTERRAHVRFVRRAFCASLGAELGEMVRG